MNIKTDKSFKYNYEKLEPSSEEFKFLKETFMTTSFRLSFDINADRLKIYKVNERNPVKTEVKPTKNLMLFHGTSQKAATAILKEGFRNSEKGYFGKGVYMTGCTFVALKNCFRAGKNKYKHYIFVNEILESEKLQIFKFNLVDAKDNSFELENQFEKHVLNWSSQPTKWDYEANFKGRRYINTPERS